MPPPAEPELVLAEPPVEVAGAEPAAPRAPSAVRYGDRKITPVSSELEYIPTTPHALPESQAQEVLKLVDLLEQDEDVQKVFHNLG